jgi:hypothetical protein
MNEPRCSGGTLLRRSGLNWKHLSPAAPEAIEISRVDLTWLARDLTHAIVKRGCREADVFDLSERLAYVLETGDGSLDGWH